MYKLKIESMKCMGCVNRIREALIESESEIKVQVDLGQRIVAVETAKPISEITEIIEGMGYGVVEME